MLVADPPSDDGQPGAGLADFDRGVALIENEAYAEAITHFDRVLAARPDHAPAFYYRALAHERLERRDDAEKDYQRAIEHDPTLVDAAVNLAALYLDDGPGVSPGPRPKKAIEVLRAIAKHAPKDVDVRANLAYAHRLTQSWDESAAQYREALRLEDRPSLRFALGDMLFEAGRCEPAQIELGRAIDGHRDELQVLVTIADELGRCKDYDGCIRALDAAVTLRPKEPDWMVRRGVCWHGAGKEDRARADFQAAVARDAKFAPAHYYLGMSYRGEQQRLKAVRALEMAAKLDPEGPVGKKAKQALAEMAAGGTAPKR